MTDSTTPVTRNPPGYSDLNPGVDMVTPDFTPDGLRRLIPALELLNPTDVIRDTVGTRLNWAATRIEELEVLTNRRRIERDGANTAMMLYKDAAEKCVAKLEDAIAMYETLRAEYAPDDLRIRLAAAESEVRRLRPLLAGAEHANKDYAEQLQWAHDTHKTNTEAYAQVVGEMQALRGQLDMKTDECAALADQIDGYHDKVRELETRVTELCEENARQETEIKVLTEANDELRTATHGN